MAFSQPDTHLSADMEFVIGQYTHGFEEAFQHVRGQEKGYGILYWSRLGCAFGRRVPWTSGAGRIFDEYNRKEVQRCQCPGQSLCPGPLRYRLYSNVRRPGGALLFGLPSYALQ